MGKAEGFEPGYEHLVWIQRFQFILWPVGSLLWLLRSRNSALAFLAGGAGSLVFWGLHRFLVARMLTPSLRRRWFYGLLTFAKLALIALLLHGMMDRMPGEAFLSRRGFCSSSRRSCWKPSASGCGAPNPLLLNVPEVQRPWNTTLQSLRNG